MSQSVRDREMSYRQNFGPTGNPSQVNTKHVRLTKIAADLHARREMKANRNGLMLFTFMVGVLPLNYYIWPDV
jgi:hypothetical protein